MLSISGQRAAQTDVEEATYHWRERATRSFRRTFTLATTADRDKIVATCRDGLIPAGLM